MAAAGGADRRALSRPRSGDRPSRPSGGGGIMQASAAAGQRFLIQHVPWCCTARSGYLFFYLNIDARQRGSCRLEFWPFDCLLCCCVVMPLACLGILLLIPSLSFYCRFAVASAALEARSMQSGMPSGGGRSRKLGYLLGTGQQNQTTPRR